MQRRRQYIRDTLHALPEGEEIETAGDSFLLAFAKPSEGVRFALQAQARLRQFSRESGLPIQERMGIHLGEVVIAENETEAKAKDLYGIQLTTGARVMSLAEGGQILLTRGVFDSARQVLKGEDLAGIGPLSWVSHGPYLLKGIEEAVEVCEVGEAGLSALAAPRTSPQAQRQVSPDAEPVLGWRPAVGQVVPNTKWELEQKLGEGGFGEVWLGRHQAMKERRVFKFCFRADRVRSLKREMTLFRLIKERIGDHPNIVALREVSFEAPPFYVEEDYVAGHDLRRWCETQGGVDRIPLEVKLELVAQTAEALQAAHDAGVIHRDVKPGNILVSSPGSGVRGASSGNCNAARGTITVKLSDFGIGQVVSQDYLAGVTKAGFTMTLLGSESSSQTGTQLYMAPELLAGKPASIRSDIYSLGIVLYQLLTNDLARPVATDWAGDVEDPLLRGDLQHCFAGKPEERFTSAGELGRNLRTWEERRREAAQRQAEAVERERLRQQTARRQRLLLASSAVALVLIALAAVLGYGLRQAHIAREKQRRLSYAADMNVAHQALQHNNLKFATQLLDRQRPLPGEEDLRGWEWRYLWQQCQPSDLAGYHEGFGDCSRFSPDGRLLAYRSGAQLIVREARSRQVLTNLPRGSTLSFSSRAPLLAVAGDTNVTVWNTATWGPVRVLSGVSLMARFSPDGRWLAAWSTNQFLLWDSATWEVKAACPGSVGLAWASRNVLSFSPNNAYLVSPGWNAELQVDTFRLWKLPNLDAVPGFTDSAEGATAAAFSGDGKHLLIGTALGSLQVWDIEQRRCIQSEKTHAYYISDIATCLDGTVFATGGDQTVVLWDALARKQVTRWRGHLGVVLAVDFAPDGKTISSTGIDGTRLWSAGNTATRHRLLGSSRAVGFLPDGKTLVAEVEDGLMIWDLASNTTANIRSPGLGFSISPYKPAANLAVSPREPVVALGKTSGIIEVWEVPSREIKRTWPAHTNAIRVIIFSPDGTQLATASATGEIRVWNIARQESVTQLAPHLRSITCLAFSPDGRQLLVCGESDTIWRYDLAHGRELSPLRTSEGWAVDAAFSPDGALLASSALQASAIDLRDMPSGNLRAVLRGAVQVPLRVAFSPDGRTLAAGLDTKGVTLWHLATGQELLHLPCDGFFETLCYSPDGRILAVGSYKGTQREIRLHHAPPLSEMDSARQGQRNPSSPPL